jgi:hypothetical protein
MRRSPETFVARLRNRKRRIIVYSTLLAVCLGSLVLYWHVSTSACVNLLARETEEPAINAVLSHQLIIGIAFMQTMMLLLCVCVGVLGGTLIVNLTAFTKDDLLVQLWDRVQSLEKSHAPPASDRQ